MNIYYTDNTLFVNYDGLINDMEIAKMKKRIFGILDDYDIENIVLNIISDNKNSILIEEFISEYHNKYRGNLLIK